ncbi:hypothetical protein PRUPE_1G522700 [Prunus persica]|uniref:Uncharacterized protein n=1 Tax=Prunus persica TaxID=3760 RepID=A0A251RHC8_PRUPE|nr:hypothetical protein PRUPE_1G522700 [Prunus persica]
MRFLQVLTPKRKAVNFEKITWTLIIDLQVKFPPSSKRIAALMSFFTFLKEIEVLCMLIHMGLDSYLSYL